MQCVSQQRKDPAEETGGKISVQAVGRLLGHVCLVRECMNWCAAELTKQLQDFRYPCLALPLPDLFLLQFVSMDTLLNRTDRFSWREPMTII